jgi:hypothetical protein
MNKREARIARQIQEKLKQDGKSARLRERVKEERQARAELQPVQKTPRAGANPGSIYSEQVTWNCKSPDVLGTWSWGVDRQWTQQEWNETILPKLQEWARLTWGEIDNMVSGSDNSRHKMHHTMDAEQICEEAQYRLIELEMYSDVIFRFRLGNLRRLWGFRQLAEFEILWYDPTHQIYPTDPE